MSRTPPDEPGEGYARVPVADLEVGVGAPYDICDAYGTLLLRKGVPVQSEQQLELLNSLGWAILPPDPEDRNARPILVPLSVAKRGSGTVPGPFDEFRNCADALDDTFGVLQSDRAGAERRLDWVVSQVAHLVEIHPEGAIGAALLEREIPELVARPLRRGVACAILAEAVDVPLRRRGALVGAALSADIGMLSLLETLDSQAGPVSSEQRGVLIAHPRRSVDILRREGLDDAVWLRAVEQHHERLDGSGYPAGLSGTEIGREARLLMIADVYMALIAPRAHREARSVTDALRELMAEAGSRLDRELTLGFVNAIGVFPPGSLLELDDGTVGLVARRGVEAKAPVVRVLADSNGDLRDPAPEYDLASGTIGVHQVLRVEDVDIPIDPQRAWPAPDPAGSG